MLSVIVNIIPMNYFRIIYRCFFIRNVLQKLQGVHEFTIKIRGYTKMKCKNCGENIVMGKYCPLCGSLIEKEIIPTISQNYRNDYDRISENSGSIIPDISRPVPKKNKKKKIIIAVAGLIGILCVSLLIIYYQIFLHPNKKDDAYLKNVYYVNNNGELCRYSDGSKSVVTDNADQIIAHNFDYSKMIVTNNNVYTYKDQNQDLQIVNQPESIFYDKEINRVVYTITNNGKYELHAWTPKSDVVIKEDPKPFKEVLFSDNGKYFTYITSEEHVVQKENATPSRNEVEIIQKYNIYRVNENGEDILLRAVDHVAYPVILLDQGAIIYYDDKDQNYVFCDTSEEHKFGKNVDKLTYFDKLKSYLYTTKDGQVYAGELDKNDHDTLITTETDHIYILAPYADKARQLEDPLICDMDRNIVSKGKTETIIYTKDGCGYYKNLANSKESIRIFTNEDELKNIKMSLKSKIYFQTSHTLYSMETSNKKPKE